MAYNELIKNFSKIREYMQDFFVYGFKRRDEYTQKSTRSYDDEKRRLEGWLGRYMGFYQTVTGKSVFISMDPRDTAQNPLYQAFRAKSFTDGDITLHFILLDLLQSKPGSTIKDLCKGIDGYLTGFDEPMVFDESTVRKKLREYEKEGIVLSEKSGRSNVYSLAPSPDLTGCADTIAFASEMSPCGVIGSYLTGRQEVLCRFKHHYITHAMDSEILCQLLDAISAHRWITFQTTVHSTGAVFDNRVLPLKIFISVQSGRQHLMAHDPTSRKIRSYRIDRITDVKQGEEADDFEKHRQRLETVQQSLWGVSVNNPARLEHLEFTVHIDDDEDYIVDRLYREKRCGTVERLDYNTYRFSCDVFDSMEMVPWLRTFICRIITFSCSNRMVEKQFLEDIDAMYKLYGIGDSGEGGEEQ